MTDETTQPAGDFFEQLADAAEATLPNALLKLKDVVDNDGERIVTVRCKSCGHANRETVKIADVEGIRKIVEMFGSQLLRAQAQKKNETASKRASELLRDLREMTSEELAEAISALEHELRAEGSD